MADPTIVKMIRNKFEILRPLMNERMIRNWAGAEAVTVGHGGISVVVRATGLSRTTVSKAVKEIREGTAIRHPEKIRNSGGGRKSVTHNNPGLLKDLEALVEPTARGDPESPLRWTCKSTRKLAGELKRQGYEIGDRTVSRLLRDLHYSLQANRKTEEGSSNPDRNAQFEYISTKVLTFQKRFQPVVSVDAKKRELVGNYKNDGQEWHPGGSPEKVNTYDFIDRKAEFGKAIPYGVYDITMNEGWVSVGIDHDTARFAVSTLRRWWEEMGSHIYPNARELLVTADGGGSNSSRSRLWKVSLQELADTVGLQISVCHFPPGTSKWNKIEHRMFCHITKNWRGRPLKSLGIIVNLISNTATDTGLHINAELDTSRYETGTEVSDEELAKVQIVRDNFHGEWNYTIIPRNC
ncbi:MAG: ISAzo13 family transposase [Lentisphaerae bacterium]|nr:ISAzo13 family transposase [Lentisphaerota bacterium]